MFVRAPWVVSPATTEGHSPQGNSSQPSNCTRNKRTTNNFQPNKSVQKHQTKYMSTSEIIPK